MNHDDMSRAAPCRREERSGIENMWHDFVQKTKSQVAEQGEIRRKWSTIRRSVGRRQLSQDDREALWGALDEEGLWTYPGIDVVNPKSDEWVYIFPREKASKRFGMRFENEARFESAIIGGLDRIRALQDVRLVEQQYYLSTGRKIDILCRRGRDKWVVIEVESGDGHRETPGQVLQYVEDLRVQTDDGGDLLVRDHQSIEAIVISQDYDEVTGKMLQQVAAANDFEARWLVAKIEFDEY